jgi:hypothetical protein
MALELKKAQRKRAYLKLGLSGGSGSGKTLGALLIGFGLLKGKYPKEADENLWSKIAIIDTENGSGELYVGRDIAGIKIGEYSAITLAPPFEADKYTSAIEMCKDNGIEVCIVDSTTHLWSGQGGLLEQQGNAAKRSGNSYTAWRDITPQHNRFVETMLQTPMHLIATMRAKQEYVQEKDSQSGKTTVRKLGMEPEQRKGMEFEFTTFFEINAEHEAFGSKDRTSLFDQKTFKITPKIGEEMMKWLDSGTNAEDVVIAISHKANTAEAVAQVKDEVVELCKTLGGSKNEVLMALLKTYTPSGNPNAITDELKLSELRSELLDLQAQQAKETVATQPVETVKEETK